MTLSKPVPHILREGDTGEVIPAELVQACAAYADSAATTLTDHHRVSLTGAVSHRGMEFATAAACFRMPDDRTAGGMRGDDGRVLWHKGFLSPPKLVVESAGGDGARLWMLRWRVPPGKFSHTTFGLALSGTTQPTPAASAYEHRLNEDTRSGDGWLALGLELTDAEGTFLDDEYMKLIQRVFLVVHQ